ncbi:Asp-tRNA(Asn)/Glu-tRNA(Gln) amidotransferase subunit GatA [Nitrospina gracilis]|uniref:Asp-tRNA(Asn)/Glu-tRNA(Gln) amidotransferase subunit GatA n=1 Tax=Nitrospina gracilis TaxID=35801 RepID=UPI001EFF6F0C|nr:Asp-tRNA(Asn)/Glu-tRNA(Gln) amidotransferase subunit GatA [Nitrospina gracilis]MCF8720097.1 aspartyl-tRNA(Asn)/glutamyl-tRNA(Gln) amidotransferase subunit A [Nitrospina gracilis Nb-211]
MQRPSLAEARKHLKAKSYSSLDLLEEYYQRIDKVDQDIGAYAHLTRELAEEQAQAADARIAKGEDAPLLGVPIAIKDLICVKDTRTTCSSRILDNFVAPYDATVVTRLKNAGAVLIGKTNMDEFAMGSSNETAYHHITRNPWDKSRVPGGSSGGSAAAVAANECVAALGSDTGGSIRQPASFCGITGLKPTYGRVSRFGLVAFASSFDQIGPMTKTVEDAAVLMNVIGGHDAMDSTSANVELPDFTATLDRDVKGLKVGVPKEYFSDGIDPQVRAAVEAGIRHLESLGMERVEVTLPHTPYAVAAYYILACAEASTNLSRYDGVKYGYRSDNAGNLFDMYTQTREEGFGEEVKRRILLGTFVLSSGYYDAYYLKGQKVRTLIKQDFDTAFRKCDVLAAPVSPVLPFKLGEKLDDPLQMYLSDLLTLSANLAGIPALSVPCGLSQEGLPIGLQLMGRHFEETLLLNVGHRFQDTTDHHLKNPPH